MSDVLSILTQVWAASATHLTVPPKLSSAESAVAFGQSSSSAVQVLLRMKSG